MEVEVYMTRADVSRSFCVSEAILSSYETSGLLACQYGENGEPVYQERDVQLVGLVSSLLDSGMERATVRQYLALRNAPSDTGAEQVRLLRRHRAKLLDNLHGCQAALERVDYLIYETEKGRKNK